MSRFLSLLPWILLIIVGITFYWYVERKNKAGTQPVVETAPIKSEATIIKNYTDTLGQNHAVIRADENIITAQQLKQPGRPKNIIDSTALQLKIATTEIQRLTQVKFGMKQDSIKAARVIDQLTKRLAFVYSDKYLNLRYTPPIDADTIGAGTFDFAYNADLTVTQYGKRKWFLGAKNSFIDIYSNDPRTTIQGVKHLTIKQDVPNFGLRVQASGNYNPVSNNAGFGPAVRVDLGRFSIQANYLYYPSIQASDNKKWRPGITGNYDIIRF